MKSAAARPSHPGFLEKMWEEMVFKTFCWPWGECRNDTAASGMNAEEIVVGLDWCDMNYFS